jgi:hypothetical protein
MRRLLALLLALPALAKAQSAREASRPAPLAEEPGCERWVGTAAGNDPSVEIQLVLCDEGGALSGKLQWSSLQSGWNLRRLAGTREADGRVHLRDLAVIEERPEPGWRFCAVDAYELAPSGDEGLVGAYVSAACDDRAALTLHRDGAAPRPLDPVGVAPPSLPPAPPTSAGCGCDSGGVALGLGFVVAGLLLPRRRHA